MPRKRYGWLRLLNRTSISSKYGFAYLPPWNCWDWWVRWDDAAGPLNNVRPSSFGVHAAPFVRPRVAKQMAAVRGPAEASPSSFEGSTLHELRGLTCTKGTTGVA